jgi:hypothetical protein
MEKQSRAFRLWATKPAMTLGSLPVRAERVLLPQRRGGCGLGQTGIEQAVKEPATDDASRTQDVSLHSFPLNKHDRRAKDHADGVVSGSGAEPSSYHGVTGQPASNTRMEAFDSCSASLSPIPTSRALRLRTVQDANETGDSSALGQATGSPV